MEDAAYLVLCLAALFAMIGAVLAGLARMVKRDTTEYDRRFLWHVYERKEEREE
ncbi:hypothetical protein GE107_01480 [Cohnella sp. CFH 77786]|uniref:hypothetical protein n=1 Tax=Cohnella sp. CFH 77786 TaxID=2662265 RepID=UPI001C60D6C6|nr:hypothetical protein [Cohnella sp. CFH 77786]MBW5444738.1 hypothetical protein [Cohnella sp. CFH 77786]